MHPASVGLRTRPQLGTTGPRRTHAYKTRRVARRQTRNQKIDTAVIETVITHCKLENLSVYRIAKFLFQSSRLKGEFRSSISALIEAERSIRRLVETNIIVAYCAEDYYGFNKTCYRPTNILEKLCHLDL